MAIRAQMREENGLPRRCAARKDSAIGVSFDTTAPCRAKKYARADVGIMQGNRRQSRRCRPYGGDQDVWEMDACGTPRVRDVSKKAAASPLVAAFYHFRIRGS